MIERVEIPPERITTQRLAVLREVDPPTHHALAEALQQHSGAEIDFAALADLLAQVATEAPDAAYTFARRIGSQVELAADPSGLRKWALYGLQQYRHDVKRRLHHFEWSDPLVFSDRRSDSDSRHLLSRRVALSHYLAGYGFGRYGVELHEPQDARSPPLAPTADDEVIRLPRRFDGVKPEDRDLFYHAVLAHIAAHLRHSPLRRLAGNRRPSLLTLTGLIEDARVERLMVREHPGLYALWGRFHTASKEQSGFHFAGLAARLARALHEPAYDDSNAWVCKGRRLFEELAERDLHDVQAFDRVARQLSIDIGKMRLAPPRDYRPAPLYRDDNVLLWNRDVPLDEDRTSPIGNFEIRAHGEVPQDLRMAEGDLRRCYRYPEWDHQLEALREEWVTVIEEARLQYSGGPAARVPPSARHRLPREFERFPDRSIRLNRLPEGDELDFNAVIDCVVQQRARVAPDGRIFCRHGHRRRTTAVVLLMDLSLSTNRFVPGTFTTVIELEKQAARMVAQALDTGRDRVALHGFASSGRHQVNYHRIKEFDEPFGEAQRASLSKLRGDLSTRMGTALRHATAALEEQVADRKVILVLTDGKPSDVDVLEDDYLVEDARHAVATAAGKGVHSFCVTLDARADEYVRYIFGTRNYLIATRASAFAGHAGQTLVRLIAQ